MRLFAAVLCFTTVSGEIHHEYMNEADMAGHNRAARLNQQDRENLKRNNVNLWYQGPIIDHDVQKVMGFRGDMFNCKNDETDATTQNAIHMTKVCDGHKDCADGSDEFAELCDAKNNNRRDKDGNLVGRRDWQGEKYHHWDRTYEPEKKTTYNAKQTRSCCALECAKMPAADKNEKDCKLGCNLWLSQSSLNFESHTWWPQLEHQCKKQCGSQIAMDAKNTHVTLTPAITQFCKFGCEAYLGCMSELTGVTLPKPEELNYGRNGGP